MTTTKQTHNGWTNYETWAVALWLDNEQGSADYWREQAEEMFARADAEPHFTKKERAALDLADALKEHHEEVMPEVEGVFADLLNAALSEVNWMEIANHYLDDIEEEEESAS